MKERPLPLCTQLVRATLEDRKTMTRRAIKPPFEVHSNGYITKPTKRERFTPYKCPYGQVGDRLWVKEAWRIVSVNRDLGSKQLAIRIPTLSSAHFYSWQYKDFHAHDYDATYQPILQRLAEKERFEISCIGDGYGRWRSPRFMYRWASRITLEITKIRIERLQDIPEGDCIAEGFAMIVQMQERLLVSREMASDAGDLGLEGTVYQDEEFEQQGDLPKFIRTWDSLNAKRNYSFESNPWVWVIEFKRIQP